MTKTQRKQALLDRVAKWTQTLEYAQSLGLNVLEDEAREEIRWCYAQIDEEV